MSTDDIYYLSKEGTDLMQGVLCKAGDVLSFDLRNVNSHNLSDYIHTLADCDQIWEGSTITNRDEKMVLLSMVLGEWVHNLPSAKTTKYN